MDAPDTPTTVGVPSGGDAPSAGARGSRVALAAVLVLAGAALLAQVDHRLEPGNADYYLRNAMAYADGRLARSRYSPGLGLFLTPLALAVGDDPGTLTFLAELLMVPVAVLGLYLVHRLLRRHLAPWPAVGVLAVFAVGQAGTYFLSGIEAEPLAMCLITGMLLALSGDRAGPAVALGGLAVLVRVALVPFVGTLWLLSLLFVAHRRRAAAAGLVTVVAGLAAHFASGPTTDPSYLDIRSATFGGGHRSGNAAIRLAEEMLTRGGDYARYGIPRLVVPYRLLQLPVGPLLAIVVLAVTVLGLARVWRRGDLPAADLLAARHAVLAFAATMAALLVWPVRAGEGTRMLLPVVAVPLLGLGKSAEALAVTPRLRHPVTGPVMAAALATFILLPTASVLLQHDDRPPEETRYLAAHREAAKRLPSGPVLAAKPAFTELSTGRPSFVYPPGASAGDLVDLAERLGVCTVVLDEYGVLPQGFHDWVDGNGRAVLGTAGETRVVALDVPWC